MWIQKEISKYFIRNIPLSRVTVLINWSVFNILLNFCLVIVKQRKTSFGLAGINLRNTNFRVFTTAYFHTVDSWNWVQHSEVVWQLFRRDKPPSYSGMKEMVWNSEDLVPFNSRLREMWPIRVRRKGVFRTGHLPKILLRNWKRSSLVSLTPRLGKFSSISNTEAVKR